MGMGWMDEMDGMRMGRWGWDGMVIRCRYGMGWIIWMRMG